MSPTLAPEMNGHKLQVDTVQQLDSHPTSSRKHTAPLFYSQGRAVDDHSWPRLTKPLAIVLVFLVFLAWTFLLFGWEWHVITETYIYGAFRWQNATALDGYTTSSSSSSRWKELMVSDLPCRRRRTDPERTKVLGLPPPMPNGGYCIKAGEMHTLTIVSHDKRGKRKCGGGDYYEVQLSGDRWRSRPRTVDNSDGSYTIQFQVDRDLPGNYDLNAVLAYDRYDGIVNGMKLWDLAILKPAISIQLEVVNTSTCNHVSGSSTEGRAAHKLGGEESLPERKPCDREIYKTGAWHGQWIRLLGGAEGCRPPYCTGSHERLNSSGWVYSTESCYFHIYDEREAWSCLGGKWWMFWGDSNNQDTARNLYNVTLGVDVGEFLPREFEVETGSDQKRPFRTTGVWNGHFTPQMDRLGIPVYKNETYREHVKMLLTEGRELPDALIINSGLHDGANPDYDTDVYVADLERALPFWLSFHTGSNPPRYIYKTTVAPAGRGRKAPGNAQRLELLNNITTARLARTGVFDIVDNFDLTFPFHYSSIYSDGGHYGRPPWYKRPILSFVDVMLGQVLLNCFCQR